MVNKIYSELGIKPIINAIGSVTLLGGSTQPQQVIEAMQSAQDMYVPMDELEKKAGDYISKLFSNKVSLSRNRKFNLTKSVIKL